jgi:hypothetical protein
VHVDRDAAAIVFDGHRVVAVDRDDDLVAVSGLCFVDRIVDKLEHHMVEPRAVIGIADVHPRALADRLQALENLDAVGGVISFRGSQLSTSLSRSVYR